MVLVRSLTKSHIERIKHPAYDSTKCEGICSRGWSHSWMLMENQRTSAGRRFQKQGVLNNKKKVCRLSCQYVNLLIIYLFILTATRPQFLKVLLFFHAIHPTLGLSTVSAGMTVNHASLLVFTLLVNSLLVSKHCPWAPAVRGIPSMSTMDTSCDSPKSLACQTFVVGFSNVPDERNCRSQSCHITRPCLVADFSKSRTTRKFVCDERIGAESGWNRVEPAISKQQQRHCTKCPILSAHRYYWPDISIKM